jgi:hypothetical protein
LPVDVVDGIVLAIVVVDGIGLAGFSFACRKAASEQ